MADNLSHLHSLMKKAGEDHLKEFIQTVRTCLAEAGRDRRELDDIFKKSIQLVRLKGTHDAACSHILQALPHTNGRENRGLDPTGRILVEYCFIRAPEQHMLFPNGSQQDSKARKEYVEGVIPRPLMRYFLVSVRGSIPSLDEFKAHSILFGAENEQHEQRIQRAKDITEEFRIPDSPTNEINWDAVYSAPQFQKIVLKLIGDVRRKLGELGQERYLRILENFKQRDPNTTGQNTMYRAFCLADVQSIDEALWNAESCLAQLMG